MIKVLHYVYKMDRGGIESLIMNIYRNIDGEKVQFHFAVHTREKGHFDDEIYELGGKIIYFPLRRKEPIRFMKEWRKFWKNNHSKYTAFHFHTPTLANIYALKMAKRYGVKKIIVHAHNTHVYKGKLQLIHDIVHNYHRNRIVKYANKFYSCSMPAAEWVFGNKSLKEIEVESFNNGIDLERFSYNKEIRKKYRDDMNLNNKFVIGHIGRFVHAKNHDYVIDIFSEVVKNNTNVVLLFIGDGELMPEIKAKVKDLRLCDKVEFLGIREDVPQLLMSMDLFLFPSLYEGLPVTMIEAQASGLPILASDRIAKEVKLVDTVNFMNIDNSAREWAKKSLELCDYKRIKLDNEIRYAGYDILDTTEKYYSYIVEE